MKVIRKHPGKGPEVIKIGNTEEDLKQQVGGEIGCVRIASDLAIICDKDGSVKGKELGFVVAGADFAGTILAVGVKNDEFTDIADVDLVLRRFFRTVRYTRADRKHNLWRCRLCDHMEQFEVDGPFENGWNVCPSCGFMLLRPKGES